MEAYLWIVSFMIFPHLNLGLLSDHKICGDPECESPMSRVQATKNHQGKDCRFLNFRRGDTIFVYHKLTGKREDLWAGSIDKQFGYFPKDAVQEEEVFTTTRKVLETQKSDFFCMDASGYPIDTTHLDTDEDDNHDIQMQEPESIQISPHSLDTKAQGSLTSTESMVKEREAEDGNKDLMDGAQLLKDGLKASATPEEQGGSPSSWMHSSVTGWLGFGKEEQSGDSEQGVREDEKEEPKSEASLTSSVTDWLGFGGEGEKDNDEDTIKIREESFTSTMTGWLGFGEKKTVTVENEEDEETGNEKEPTEKFRSRRMSLDLEGSKLQEEEKEDMGTLGWLGSGLSSRLGFGSSAQDSGNGEGVKEEPASSSWIEMTISKGFGFRDSNTEPEENKESGISETEKDPTLEQPDGSENIHISQSQTSFSEEIKAKNEKESQMKELVNVSSSPPASNGSGDAVDDNVDNSDTKEANILDIDAGMEVFNKDVQNFSQIDDGKEGRPIENMGENEIKGQQISQNDEVIEQPEVNLGPDRNLKELDSNSIEQLEHRVEEGGHHHILIKASRRLKEEGAEITKQVHQLEESPLMSENSPVSGDDHKDEQFNNATGSSEQKILGEESPEENQVSGDHEEINEQSRVVVSSTETEVNQGESGLQQEMQPVDVSSQEDGSSFSGNAESLYHNVSEDNGGQTSSNKTTPNINTTPGSPQMDREVMQRDSDADNFKETVKDQNELTERETLYDESKLKPTVGSESQTEATEGLVEEEKAKTNKQEEANEIKEQIKEVKQQKLEDINKNEIKNEEIVNISGEGRGLTEERPKEVVELEEGEKSEIVSLDHEEAGVERLKESEEPNEKKQEKQEKMADVSGESSSEEFRDESQKDLKTLNVEEKQVEELLECGNQIRMKDLKESEEQNKKEEKAEFSVEAEREIVVDKQKGEENQITKLPEREQATLERSEKSNMPNEKKEAKEKKVKVFGESNRDEGKELIEKMQKEDNEPKEKEKSVKELVEDGNQVRVEDVKKDEKQVQEEQLEHKKTDIWRPEVDHFERQMLENSTLASLVSETNAQTEVQKKEDEEKEKKVEMADKEELEKEKQHLMKEVEDDNVDVGGSEDEGLTLKLSDDGIWKEDRQDRGLEKEIRETDATKTGTEFQKDSAESQFQTSEQTDSTHPPPGTESETGGAFGLFKNAFGFFSQTPTPVMTESTQAAQSFNPDSAEASQPHASFTPEPDSSTDLLHREVTHTVIPTEQPDLHPVSAENLLHNVPSVTEAPSKTPQPLTKLSKNLHHHMNADEEVILLDLFGRHKLQFLDYILTSSEVSNVDDQSILSDVERLLQHHMETLVAPSMRTSDAPKEDKQRTKKIIALQKLETLLKTVKEAVSTGISDVSNHQAGHSSSRTKEKQDIYQPPSSHEEDGVEIKHQKYLEEERRDKGSKEKTASLHHTQPGSQHKGLVNQSLEFIHGAAEDFSSYAHAVMAMLVWIIVQAVSLLPEDLRPGPDLYGVPWEPVIFTGLVGLVTFMLFTSRCYRSMKSRLYRRKEQRLADQVGQVLDEKCKVLETLSQCQQEYDDLENLLRDSGVLAQTQKSEHLEVQAKQLEETKKQLGTDLEHLKEQLAQQREHRKEQERRITLLEESMNSCEEETKELNSKEEQARTSLKIYSMSSERLQRNLETADEENNVLQESNTQLKLEVEGWAERVSELEAEMRRCEVAHSAMMQDVAVKDERITSLTDRLLRMKCWDSDLEDDEGGEKEATNGTPGKEEDAHLQKVQKLIFAAKLNADLKSVDEDKDRVFAKLNDEIKAKEDLQVSVEEMEKEKLSLQSDTESYTDQVDRLQQKLQIMTEMYQENELKLHRKLTVEEKERHQKEEKLSKADKNIAMAIEELNNYRKRADEMEEELEKTKQSYHTQISAHEKKAHNNWLAARSAERELGDIRRENALLRQKLTDTQLKLDSLDKDPYALNNLARPLPFRAERSPYAPSPLGRPASETRPFLSPPTLMDGLPGRLSPRVSRGPGEPPGCQAEMERSGGPHSDSGSISPTWERDRRGPPPGPPGPLGPPGYIFPEPRGPMFRRPPPPPGVLGSLPPPGALPPGAMPPRGFPLGPPHPLDMADGSFRENRVGPGEQDHREFGPGGQRTPPELDPRMGGPPPPGPPGIPIDGPYPRRGPYGPPPPPDFYPPRIPGGPPMRPMWPPPPQGMMLPPRFPSGGPLPPAPNPNVRYGPPFGLPPSDGLPPPSMGPPPPRQQSLPSPPHSQSPEENRPSPEDAI